MTDCHELIEKLHDKACTHVELALVASAMPVAEMLLELAAFSKKQAYVAEVLCADV